MEKVWEDDSPHSTFFRRLLNDRVDEMVNSPTWLKRLRYRHEEVKWWMKRAKFVFEERGINLYQLIAQAHGECWDEEDEEKSQSRKNVVPSTVKKKPRQNAVSMDHSREIGVRGPEEEEL